MDGWFLPPGSLGFPHRRGEAKGTHYYAFHLLRRGGTLWERDTPTGLCSIKTYIISSHNDNMIYFLLLFGLRPGSPAPLSSAPACGILLHQGSIHPFVLVMTLTVALALAGGRECARGRRTKKNESVCSWVERHWATKRAACLCNVLV